MPPVLLAAPDRDLDIAPQPGVATSEDMDMAIGVALIAVIAVASIAGVIITDRGGRRARDRSRAVVGKVADAGGCIAGMHTVRHAGSASTI